MKTLVNISEGHNIAQTKRDQTIQLPDGRMLGFAEFGNSIGYPVFLFHGTPGSRLWFAEDDPVAQELGLRQIAVDRPGYGLSSPKKNHSILDFPADVAALANYLGLNKFAVLGTSGGSVYAAACGYALPKQVQKVIMVSAIAPFENGKPPKEMCAQNRTAFFLSAHLPWLARLMFRYVRYLMNHKPESYLQSVRAQVNHLCASDRKIIQQEAEFVLLHMQEALRQNEREAALEPGLIAQGWGFSPANISVPVVLWQGTEDTLAPIGPVQAMAKEIASCQTHFIEGKGHFLDGEPEHWREMLRSALPT